MTHPLVQRAIIPAAGKGKRMLSVTNGKAKELLTVGGKTLLARGLDDLSRAGITECLIITSPQKPEIRQTIGQTYGGMTIQYVEQHEQHGLADAISLAESFCKNAPFICWLPDNLWDGQSASAQLIQTLRIAPTAHIVALLELTPESRERYGAAGFVESTPLQGAARSISLVYPKGVRTTSTYKGFPLDLYQPDIFDRIRVQRARRTQGELDDTPILQELAREGKLVGRVLQKGTLYDCGIPVGFDAACRALSSE